MLKTPTKVYQDAYIDSSKSKKLPMSDEQVEKYIHAFFNTSPKASCGTAPTFEWLQFLELFNEQQNHFVLTEQQKKAIKPYCIQNPDLEMTPEEFIKLLSIIRHEPTIEEPKPRISSSTPSTRKLFDSRPRSSKLMSSRSIVTYYDDRASTNHPDDSLNHMSDRTRESDENNYNNDYGMSLVSKLRKEKNAAARQLREHESRIVHLHKEHSERISQLQTRLENVQIEADQQKQLLADQKIKERDKLERITELKTQNEEYEKTHQHDLRRLQKKTEELQVVKAELHSLNETHEITQSKLKNAEIQAKETARAHEKEKADLHMKLDQEKRQASEARQELEVQQSENVKLMELIDKQKFDLDEARSGLRDYSNTTPILDKKSSSDASKSHENDHSEQTFAHEQIEAKYLKKLELLAQERDAYQQQLILVQEELKREAAAAAEQSLELARILGLSQEFDQQLDLIESIRESISSNQHGRRSKLCIGWSIIPWVFLLYHLFLILTYYIIEITQTEPLRAYPFSFLRYIDELFFTYLHPPY